MMQTQQLFIPQQLRYESIRPKGWFSKFKQWPIEPLSSNQYWSPSEIVRFLFQLTSGFMDPYRSHIMFKVGVPSTMTVGGLQVDNSAQSFFSQMVCSSNNIQIERITNYDDLAAFLSDIGLSQVITENRQWQGLGFTQYQVGMPSMYPTSTSSTTIKTSGTGGPSATDNNNNYITQMSPGYVPHAYTPPFGIMQNDYCIPATFTSVRPFLSQSSYYYLSNASVASSFLAQTISSTGLGSCLRAQYSPDLRLRDYVDSNSSYLTNAPVLNPPLNASDMLNGNHTSTPNYNLTYSASVSGRWLSGLQTVSQTFTSFTRPNTATMRGYTKPASSKFSVGCFQPMISNTIPQCQFAYGQVLATPVVVPVRQFSIPLMSSIIGILLPADQFCLIPLTALRNFLVQLTVNPYGMFSTGYSDFHEFDASGMLVQIPRTYQISQIYYNLHIYQFPDEQIQQYLNTALAKQIAITASSWTLSGQYQLPTGASLRGSWTINVGSQFLGQVVVLFISNEYMKYTFCRKQFRLSNNVRSFQIRFNTDYFPAQPILGNGGNPVLVDSSGDNSQFLMRLLTAYNYKFTTQIPQPRINAFNFAINARCYDPTNTNTAIKLSQVGQGVAGSVLVPGNFNTDTAIGYPSFHQNRFVGRAAYMFSFQPYAHSRQYMVGVDSRDARPFQLLFDTWGQNTFPTDQTMVIFTRASVVNVYGANGVKVLGR